MGKNLTKTAKNRQPYENPYQRSQNRPDSHCRCRAGIYRHQLPERHQPLSSQQHVLREIQGHQRAGRIQPRLCQRLPRGHRARHTIRLRQHRKRHRDHRAGRRDESAARHHRRIGERTDGRRQDEPAPRRQPDTIHRTGRHARRQPPARRYEPGGSRAAPSNGNVAQD